MAAPTHHQLRKQIFDQYHKTWDLEADLCLEDYTKEEEAAQEALFLNHRTRLLELWEQLVAAGPDPYASDETAQLLVQLAQTEADILREKIKLQMGQMNVPSTLWKEEARLKIVWLQLTALTGKSYERYYY